MALDNCKDCPASCLGNILPADCVVYNEESLSTFLDNLPTTPEESIESNDTITTDNIVSKSLVRNTSAVCSSKIINRTITYTLSATQTTTTLGWNMLPLIGDLPSGYDSAVIRVRVTGNTVNGKNVISDNRTPSGAVGIRVDQYPVSVDFLIRVTSPCGDVDLQKTVKIPSIGNLGTFNVVLTAEDLNPQTGEIVLTDQLNSLESKVNELGQVVGSMPNTSGDLAQQQLQIDQLEEAVSNPSSFDITYNKNGTTTMEQLDAIIKDLYGQIESLKAENLSQSIELESLRADIDSLNNA